MAVMVLTLIQLGQQQLHQVLADITQAVVQVVQMFIVAHLQVLAV
jgi:hypothetical protein